MKKQLYVFVATLVTATMVLSACSATTPETSAPEIVVPEIAAAAEEIVLDVRASNPEYLNGEQQIWSIYEAQNPGVKINLFALNEDQLAAYEAKLAGGYVPAIDTLVGQNPVDANNYQNYVNLLTVDFKWFDRWQYDIRTASEEVIGVPGVYTLDPYQGFVFTWLYHADLMEQLGLDPREVKTQADLKDLLAKCSDAVAARDDIDYCWDMAWHNWGWNNYFTMMPMPYADGQYDIQRESWAGQIDDPTADPFRYSFEFFAEAYQNGWLPENFWLRDWETDMEASFVAKKSVMLLHGPWIWDKTMAADPSAQLLGIPGTPPENAGDPWMQYMGPPNLVGGYLIPIGNLDKPEWPQILDAYNWWHSPEVIKMRAELEGRAVLYTLDEPLELEGPQWKGVLQELQPGGLYETVVYETSQTGDTAIAKYKNEGAGNWFDWQWNDTWQAVVQNEMTVDEALQWFHEQVSADYNLP